MLVFGRMYVDNEMAVLGGGGISRGRLSWFLLPLVTVVFLIQSWLTLVGKPWGVAKASNIWQEQSVVEVFDLIRPKQFISSGDYHLYVGEVGENKDYLKDVIVILMNGKGKFVKDNTPQQEQTLDVNKLPKELVSDKDTIIFARSATQVDSDDGVVRLDLHEGRRYEVDAGSQEYSQVGFGRYRISLAGKSTPEGKAAKIEALPTMSLMDMLDDTQAPYTNAQIKAELGYRGSLPWLIILAVMLATPLAMVRPRQGRWLKLIPAIFIFVANVLILISLKETISKGKLGVWAYPMAVVLLFIFACYLNYHERLVATFRLQKGKLTHQEMS